MRIRIEQQAKRRGNYQRWFVFLAVTLAVAGCFLTPGLDRIQAVGATEASVTTFTGPIGRSFGQIPLSFTVNQGQADPRVKFLSQGPGYKLSLTSAEAVLTLSPPATARANSAADQPIGSGVAFKMKLVGSNRKAVVEGLEELPGKSNYFIGKDPKKWRTNVPTYARVKYRDVYPGVDLVYYGNQQQIEYDLIVAPAADARVIKLSFEGAETLQLDRDGNLIWSAQGREVRQLKPVVFQEVAGRRKAVEGSYSIRGRDEVAIVLGPYDRTRPLVIDPLLVFSTTGIGGNAIAVDLAGNTYLTGSTNSDVFISKLNPSGTALVYTTTIGGSDVDSGWAIAVDAVGNATVAGVTNSADFPTTPGAHATFLEKHRTVFVATLNPSGSALVTSTHLTVATDFGWVSFAVDTVGNAYVVGMDELVVPAIPGIVETSRGYMYVRKINAQGITYSFRFSDYDPQIFFPEEWQSFSDIAVDTSGNAYILAETAFDSIVTTPGAFQTTHSPLFTANGWTRASADTFVMKLSAHGSLIYSTYVAGRLGSQGKSIGVDSAGNAHITGKTASTDFPVTREAYQTSFNGGTCTPPNPPPFPILFPCSTGFLTKLNSSGTGLLLSTYTHFYSVDGQEWDDGPSGIAIDNAGDVYLTGATQSSSFPATPDAIQRGYAGGTCGDENNVRPCVDAFLAKFNSSGTALKYATYLGGNKNDSGKNVVVDYAGNIYLSGYANSPDFPVTAGAYQSSTTGGFTLRIAPDVLSVSAAHFNLSPIPREAIVAAFGVSLATSTESASSLPLPTSLGGSQVVIKDSAGIEHVAPLFYVSPTQINYFVPSEAATGPAVVSVTSGDGRVWTGLILISEVSPALFTLNQTGSGAAAALDAFMFTGAPFAATRADGQPNILSFFGTGLGADATGEDGIDVSSSVEVTIDGTPTATVFAGSASGYTGLNQLNVVLPFGISSGNHTVEVSRNGVKSNLVTIAIR